MSERINVDRNNAFDRVDQRNRIGSGAACGFSGDRDIRNIGSQFHNDRDTSKLLDHPKIWAGGDLTNGGMEVVNAVAEGKRAALAINGVLNHG